MDYLFSKCNHTGYGLGIPDWAVERWQRQAATPYADLPESEKESDRAEADRMLAIVGSALDAAMTENERLRKIEQVARDYCAINGTARYNRLIEALNEATDEKR